METTMISLLAGVFFTVLYFVVPAVLIVWLIRRFKNRKPGLRRSYKVISIPLLLLNAVPAFVISMHEYAEMSINEDLWYGIMGICFLAEVIITLIECKWSGIWISIVRFALGTMLGILAGVTLLLGLGALLVLGFASSAGERRTKTVTIYRNGQAVTLVCINERDNIYSDPETQEVFTMYDSDHVISSRDGSNYGVY